MHRHSFFLRHTLGQQAGTGFFFFMQSSLRGGLSPAAAIACLLVTQLYVIVALLAAPHLAVATLASLGLTGLVAAQQELVLALLGWVRLAWSLAFAPLRALAL